MRNLITAIPSRPRTHHTTTPEQIPSTLILTPIPHIPSHYTFTLTPLTTTYTTHEKHFLLTTLQSVDDGAWSWDLATSTVTLCSQLALIILGSTSHTSITLEEWDALIVSEDAPSVLDARKAHLEGRLEVFDCELRLRVEGGRWAWVHMRGRVVGGEEGRGRVRMVGLVTPLPTRHATEGRLGERARRVEMALGEARSGAARRTEFIAGVAREVGEGLRRVVDVCEGGASGKEVLEEVRGALGVVDDMLDISLLSLQTLPLTPQLLNLPNVINQTITPFTKLASVKSVQLFIEIAPSTPQFIVGDASRISQILSGIVSHSVKETERGRVVVGVRASERNEGKVLISVADTGKGFGEGDIKSLFRAAAVPPSSSTSSSSAQQEGSKANSGRLRMCVCERLVRVMGGEVRVRSLVGIGSVFEFEVGGLGKDISSASKRGVECPRPVLKRNVTVGGTSVETSCSALGKRRSLSPAGASGAKLVNSSTGGGGTLKPPVVVERDGGGVKRTRTPPPHVGR
ncbi:hypothetical protein HK097_005565, partial [Rhizophlyctis rosea]